MEKDKREQKTTKQAAGTPRQGAPARKPSESSLSARRQAVRRQAKRKQIAVWGICGGVVLALGLTLIILGINSRFNKGKKEAPLAGESVASEELMPAATEEETQSAAEETTEKETTPAGPFYADQALAAEVGLNEEGTAGVYTEPEEFRLPGVSGDGSDAVTIVAAGDNLLHLDVQYSCINDADGSFNFDRLYMYVKDRIQAADIAVINQECVIAGDQYGVRGYPSFNCVSSIVQALKNAGFDVITAANNHILDMGTIGPIHMVQYFRNNYPELELLGIHDSWETRDELHVIECKGMRIGMVNYSDLSNNMVDYRGNEYLVDMYQDKERLANLIRQTKEASDFLVVFPHWGTEYVRGTDEKQAEETEFLASLGVDLVIGTHPHVVEPIEFVDRPDGGKMLVYYSLGNYISFQHTEASLLGGLAKVTLQRVNGKVSIVDFDMGLLATEYHLGAPPYDFRAYFNTYPIEMFTRDIANASTILGWNEPFSVDYMFALAEELKQMVRNARSAVGLE